ncbi:hypothetical protein MK489_10600 [Myxococcota bacterium]|nr:hypothetical protein [Myxococcota bacterium]
MSEANRKNGGGRIRLTLSAQAERYARTDAPRQNRLMAARGALPLKPLELATVLFALAHDPDAEVKSAARNTLEALPAHVLDTVLSANAHPALLSHLARTHEGDESRAAAIALNPAAGDDTVSWLATLPFKSVVEVVANNQERLLRSPEIVESLGANPLTSRSTIDRILGFLNPVSEPDGTPEGTGQDGEITEVEEEAAMRAVLGEDFAAWARRLVTETERDECGTRSGNLQAMLQQMTVIQKIKLARLGNKEARGLLARDRNRIVAIAAINSPKLTESEVVSYAQSRNISEEVLRAIARNSQWTRSYATKLALTTNPKCPHALAMKFVNHLQDRDLRAIMKSKDVHTLIASQARRILMKKGRI